MESPGQYRTPCTVWNIASFRIDNENTRSTLSDLFSDHVSNMLLSVLFDSVRFFLGMPLSSSDVAFPHGLLTADHSTGFSSNRPEWDPRRITPFIRANCPIPSPDQSSPRFHSDHVYLLVIERIFGFLTKRIWQHFRGAVHMLLKGFTEVPPLDDPLHLAQIDQYHCIADWQQCAYLTSFSSTLDKNTLPSLGMHPGRFGSSGMLKMVETLLPTIFLLRFLRNEHFLRRQCRFNCSKRTQVHLKKRCYSQGGRGGLSFYGKDFSSIHSIWYHSIEKCNLTSKTSHFPPILINFHDFLSIFNLYSSAFESPVSDVNVLHYEPF
jgi:hypothetical protein